MAAVKKDTVTKTTPKKEVAKEVKYRYQFKSYEEYNKYSGPKA